MSPQPNLVLIMTDQQGANAVGCYGAKGVRTDRIDTLASQGLRFERAYTASPVCTPARAGLHSGMYPHTAGAWTNALGLEANTRTLAQRLAAEGYQCAHFGKWHLDGHDYFGTGTPPDPFTAETWYDGRNFLEEFPEEKRPLTRKHPGSAAGLREQGVTEGTTWGGRVCQHSTDFIQRASGQDQPFFLTASFDEPHGPSLSPPEDYEAFEGFSLSNGPGGHDDLSTKPSHQLEWSRAHDPNRRPRTEWSNTKYFAANHFVDRLIGRIVDTVDHCCAENTWILYCSDHGDFLGAHSLGAKGPAMYDDITRVPFILRPPAGHQLQGTIPQPVSLVDVVPTFLELAGVNRPPILDGVSLVPYLSDQDASGRGDVLVEFNRFEVGHDGRGGLMPIRCLIRGPWKFVINLFSEDELYNLEQEPGECVNLLEVPEHENTRNNLHDALLQEMDRQRDPFRGAVWERRPWRTDRTRGWVGPERQRPHDGVLPSVLAYPTGRPPDSDITTPA